MTLSTETVALLRYGIDALLHLTGPASYALLTPDERKTALQHLMVTAEAAATFAEVAQGEALALPKSSAGDTERIKAEGELQDVQVEGELQDAQVEGELQDVQVEADGKETEAERLGRHRDRSMLETKRLQAELVQVRKEKVIIEGDRQWLSECLKKARGNIPIKGMLLMSVGGRQTVMYVDRLERSVEKLAAEKARIEGEEESMCKAIESSVKETERLRTETIMQKVLQD